MRSGSFYTMLWVLVLVALAGVGFVTLDTPRVRDSTRGDYRPLSGSPLVGCWTERGDAARYRINITPSVLFITSFDEADICEIEVFRDEHPSEDGSLQGVIRLYRVDYRNFPHEGCPAMISYRLHDEVLELSWPESPELSSWFTTSELIAVRRSESDEPVVKPWQWL